MECFNITYIRGLENLSLTNEQYDLILLDCQIILNTGVSPEAEIILLLNYRVLYFTT
jgi:hypothetical protein